MRDEDKQEILTCLREAVESALDDRIDELSDHIRDVVDETVSRVMSEAIAEGIEGYLSSHQFILQDGTVLQARQKSKILSPDKKKLFICYGGARVDDTSKWSGSHFPAGWSLNIQTQISTWESIYVYEKEADAVDALKKVCMAMEQGVPLIEL